MDARGMLLDGFRYDDWANRRWIEGLGEWKDASRPFQILEHILQAQLIWLGRCGVETEVVRTDEGLDGAFARVSREWQAFLEEADLDLPIAYATRDGRDFVNEVGQIALHVLHHGTYHRGHLRGLAEAEGVARFPESDLILYFRE